MKKKELSYIKKGREILWALKKYGPMNRRTLQFVVPTIKDSRNFRRTLSGLCGKNLIVKRKDGSVDNKGTFYQINQNSGIRDILAAYFDAKSEDFQQRNYRYRELYHEQIAAQLAYYFQSRFPEAEVVRDFEFHRNANAQKVLFDLKNIESHKPDALLFLKPNYIGDKVAVAIEFERTEKARSRLASKMFYYTNKSKLDGVILLGSIEKIETNISEVYKSRVLERALRIKQYGQNFLVFSRQLDTIEESLSSLHNVNFEKLDLGHWLSVLCNNLPQFRRNSHFGLVPSAGVAN